jgi:hypothetical protein
MQVLFSDKILGGVWVMMVLPSPMVNPLAEI